MTYGPANNCQSEEGAMAVQPEDARKQGALTLEMRTGTSLPVGCTRRALVLIALAGSLWFSPSFLLAQPPVAASALLVENAKTARQQLVVAKTLADKKEALADLKEAQLNLQASEGAEVKEELKETEAAIEAAEASIAADAIGKTARPMTAVLFTPSFRSQSYEVQQDPDDPNMGKIALTDSGGVAGVLIAAEAPFALPSINGRLFPLGAWFGVQLQTGTGTDTTVDLAAGVSVLVITKKKLQVLISDFGEDAGTSPARLLLGLTYGKRTTLGGGLEVGDEFPLGATVPLEKHSAFEFTFGLGFRF